MVCAGRPDCVSEHINLTDRIWNVTMIIEKVLPKQTVRLVY